MGGPRALIASLGASISLVAGAALALLVVSFLFAYDGLAGGADVPASHAPLLVAGPSRAAPDPVGGSRPSEAVVITTPARRRVAVAVKPTAPPRGLREGSGGVQTRRPASTAVGVGDLGAATTPSTTANPIVPPATGDAVRDLGDGVSSTVGDTGGAAGAAALPLGPPVSQAVQDVLNLVQSLLKGATNGLAGALDGVPPRR